MLAGENLTRFLTLFERPKIGCWLWKGYTDAYGYGGFTAGGKTRKAHRLSYELYVDEIPEGLEIDHLCRNRACVNPDHLEAVTHRENMLRSLEHSDGPVAVNARKTHCIHGHEYTEENTFRKANGHRECRTCRNARRRAASQRQAA